jgi:hypothetical protein
MPDDQLPNIFGDTKPPEMLKSRVIATLTSTGPLAPARGRVARTARWAALLAAALFAGFMLGRAERASASDVPRYLLLLYEDSTYRDDRPVSEIVAEYARWADSLRGTDVLELGEKLADQPRHDPTSPTGFFVIRAADAATASSIAASSPHVRHGGGIVVRAIEDTRRR